MSDFFKEETKVEETQEEKIKLGETEFSPQELEDLVGAGRRLKEIEEKQGQPVDDILKSWGERGNVIGEQKKKLEEYEKAKAEALKPKETLDEEAAREQVISEAKKYGLLTKDEAVKMVEEVYENKRAVERLINQTNKVLRSAIKEGKPETTADKLLDFMSDPANPKDPEKAYKIMFEKELEEWKDKKLMGIKRPGFITEATSTAGSKTPSPKVANTREELTQQLMEHMRASE